MAAIGKAAVGALVLGVIVVGAFGCGSDSPPASAPAAAAAAASKTGTAAHAAGGWERLPAPRTVPEQARLLGIGGELLLYGGCAHEFEGRDCGASNRAWVFDPGAVAWHGIDPSPVGVSGAGAWTGTEAILVDSGDGATRRTVAYDPETGWSMLARAPRQVLGGSAVWDGSEVVVWGGGKSGAAGAAYDPASDEWRVMPRAPLGLNSFDLVWTGTDVIAFGSELDGRNIAASRRAVGAAYNPASNSWHRIAPSRLSPQATTAVWLGDRMLAYDYAGRSQAYDPAADSWSGARPVPVDSDECYPDSVATSTYDVAFYCGQVAVFDPAAEGRWEPIHGGLTEREHHRHGVQLPVWRFAQLADVNDLVYVLAEGVTFGRSGIAQYNFPDSPHSFWALDPEAAVHRVRTTTAGLHSCGGRPLRVAGISCRRATGLVYGVPGGHAVRIPARPAGSVVRTNGFVCRYVEGSRGPNGARRGPRTRCVDVRRGRELRVTIP